MQALSDVHFKSVNLYLAADSVFVYLFKVLDRIIEELSKNMASTCQHVPLACTECISNSQD